MFREVAKKVAAGEVDCEQAMSLLPGELSREEQRACRAIVDLIDEQRKAVETIRREMRLSELSQNEFMATVSHEIRTPLNPILGMTEFLLAGELSPEQRNVLTIIYSSAELLSSLINDILDYSKIVAGMMKLERVQFNPTAIIEECMEMMADRARRKGLGLSGFCDPRLPDVVLGDPSRIKQIALNLLSNAIKFTNTGEVSIRIFIIDSRDDIDCTKIRIRGEVLDSGVGIAAKDIGKLFQPFVQADDSISRRFGGTGLGLAICKRLCQLMGGDIGVVSEPGRGSLFW
ncbi:MAG: ATP-binding protein, partial [Negativicutes bacterium]|nr:ATP-binding protein [Negativicutes bacterium]